MRTVCYHCGNYADGADHPNNLRAELARLQEQVETLRRERDVAVAAMVRNDNRAEAAEAERDRLREAMDRARTETVEEVLSLLTCHELYRYRPKAFDGFVAHVRAALQKEPQP